MKIFKVTFNDGGWHSGNLPSVMIVASTKEEALKKAKDQEKYYTGWDSWAVEFKIDGYVIEVYDESTYKAVVRDRKIDIVSEKID